MLLQKWGMKVTEGYSPDGMGLDEPVLPTYDTKERGVHFMDKQLRGDWLLNFRNPGLYLWTITQNSLTS